MCASNYLPLTIMGVHTVWLTVSEREQRGDPKAHPPENVRIQFEAGTEPEREFPIDRHILKRET